MPLLDFDHMVLTVKDLQRSIAFYEQLGMQHKKFTYNDGRERHAVYFGNRKINLHPLDKIGTEYVLVAEKPTSGSADICFLTEDPLDTWMDLLAKHEIPIIEGPVERHGAVHGLLSIYIRDPDGNLLEIANKREAGSDD